VPEHPAWHEVRAHGNYFKHSVIASLEFAAPGLAQLLRDQREALGMQGKRAMPMPTGQKNLDNALVRSLQNRDIDCDDKIDDGQRAERVQALLRAGANPNASTSSGRAMGEAINTLDMALVDALLSMGASACHQDMAVVLESRIGGVDSPSDFKLVMDNANDEEALFQIVAQCYPLDFSWSYKFEVYDWEGDKMQVDMMKALDQYAGRIQAGQDQFELESNTRPIACAAAVRRI
jgi:hypothetical protein